MRKDIVTSAIGIVVLTLLLGVIYPLVVTGVSQVAFPGNANGQKVYANGKLVGSKLIGQNFADQVYKKGKPQLDKNGNPVTNSDPRYFQTRPSGTCEEALSHAVELGVALQLTNILRDIGEDAQRNRIYLPQEEMKRFGYSDADLMAGIVNEAFCELLRFPDRPCRRLLPACTTRHRSSKSAMPSRGEFEWYPLSQYSRSYPCEQI